MNSIAPLKILKASAGSGKTFSLTVHYLVLLLAKESNYREILAVTFTNKATAEMKERILGVLYGLAMNDRSNKINDFRKAIFEESSTYSEIDLQQKAYRIYRRILHDYSHFTVSTIDSFSQKVVRSFTYELNLDAGYKIEMNTEKVKKDLTILLNGMLNDRPDLLQWIMEYAEKKIDSNENWNYRRELMKLSGLIFTENFQEFDGTLHSSKTNEVFNSFNRSISNQIENYLETLSEAIVAFRNIFESSGVTADDLFGKSRNRLIALNKISPKIAKMRPTDIKEKIFDRFLKIAGDQEVFKGVDKAIRYDLMQLFEPIIKSFDELWQVYPNYVACQAIQDNIYYLRLLKEMSNLLSHWRKENSAQLISDSQILLNKLGLDGNNDPTFIWEKIGNRYNYFLFDEFQDTSRIQWKNYSPLLMNALSHASGQLSEHLIVGDVKQSIYRWRNGDWRILLQQVEEEVVTTFHLNSEQRKAFVKSASLEKNHRSLPNIIRFNNYIYKEFPEFLQKALNETVFETLKKDDDIKWWNDSGNSIMLKKAYDQSQQQIPQHKQGEEMPQGEIDIAFLPVENSRFRNSQVKKDSIDKLCLQIGEWLSLGKYQPKQIGILVRSNDEIKAVVEALMAYKNETGLVFDVISGAVLSLGNNDAVLLLIETLKAIIYNDEKQIIYKANLVYLYQSINKQSHFENDIWLKFKENNIQSLQRVLPGKLISEWDNLCNLPLIHLIEKLIEVYNLSSQSLHLPYLLAFKGLVSTFSSAGEKGIIQFLEYWEEDGKKMTLPSESTKNAIEVLTVHKSKGLAYDVVMIPFTWQISNNYYDFWIDVKETPFYALGKIPVKFTKSLQNSLFYKPYYEEMLFNYMDALNTFYVATTRAIRHLYIIAPFFAEKEDKKTGDIELDIKNEFITDSLYEILRRPNPYRIVDKEFHLQDPNFKARAKEESRDDNSITLESYPLSKELESVFNKSSKRNIATLLTLEKAAQYGILAHEIMSAVSRESDISGLVEHYIEEGILAIEDKEELFKHIYDVWNHPQISKWLKGNYKIWNEADIITSSGESIRPDKVFTSDEETIVLDFKFTQGDHAGHKAQVDQYMKALENLGYSNIKGYLFYAKNNFLQEVN